MSRSARARRRRSSRRCSYPSRSRCRARPASVWRTSARARCRCGHRAPPPSRSFLGAELIDGGDLLVPDDLARVAVERDHATVREVRDHEVLPECDAARAGNVAFVLHTGIADPDELALVRVARDDLVNRAPAVAGIHEAIVDERIDLAFRSILA